MIGGKMTLRESEERVFRVEFPERPGALMKFLDALGSDFNISMFHYRNHGAAYGRILVGFTDNDRDRSRLITRLDQVGRMKKTNNP